MNPRPPNIQELESLIRQKYGSLDAPHFDFVKESLEARPYDAIIEEIKQRIAVEEDTDPNEDVSFGYILTKGEKTWLLRISMLGPYAVLFRLPFPQKLEFVPSVPQECTDEETKLVELLNRNRIHLLGKVILSRPIALELFDTEKEKVSLYHALFSDSGELPWEE